MCEKAKRFILIILLLAGSQVAYPQLNFPQNLTHSIEYWTQTVTFPEGTKQKELSKQWSDYSDLDLSDDELSALENTFLLANHYQSRLTKEERLFLSKYQHLAIYLSGFNPIGATNNDRTGIWMLTFPDARRYGLIVNEYVDERRDLLKSTQAARALFKDLKKMHGPHAEAMFVLGAAGWVRTSDEEISELEERLTALRLVSKNYETNADLTLNDNWIKQKFDGDVGVDVLALEMLISDQEFRLRNPTIVGRMIPDGTTILIPGVVDGHRLISATSESNLLRRKQQDSLVNRIKRNIPSPETHNVITYRVKSGDVLGRIAEHYGVRVSKIKKWNNLRSDRIDINQKLTIYYPKGKKIPKKVVAKSTPKPEVKLKETELGKFTIYEVQPGDTLWAISKKFTGVKPEDIMSWNSIGEDLSIGQKLKIKKVN